MPRRYPLLLPAAAALLLAAAPAPAAAQATCAPPVAGKMTRCTVGRAAARKAVCNDGSPAVFYVDPGRGAGRDKWVVYLQGGGAAGTIPDLWKRWFTDRGHMSSRGYPAAMAGEGILAPSPRNPFGTWNRVYVRYCSSDLHAGDGEARSYLPPGSGGGVPSPATWQFRGKRIVRAILEDLAAGVPGMPRLSAAGALLFGGGSAGSIGARHNLDDVAAYVQGLDKARAVKVRGFLDAGFSPTDRLTPLLQRRRDAYVARASRWVVDLLGPTLAADLLAQNRLDLWNAQLDATCVAAVGRDACLGRASGMAHVETPFFMYMDLLDGNSLRKFGVNLPAIASAEDLQVLEAFATQVVELLAAHLGAHPEDGLFLSFEGYHTAGRNGCRFGRLTVAQGGRAHSLAAALKGWFDGTGPRVVADLTPPARFFETCGRR